MTRRATASIWLPWLDYSRYADSNGYQTDGSRYQWPWRDWLINALNRNLPYNQFTVEQLAGDLLPDATIDQKIATGFNRNHRINGEGGIIAEEWRIETVIDRVETTGATWLGLTLGAQGVMIINMTLFLRRSSTSSFHSSITYLKPEGWLGKAPIQNH